jgi:hypothetical protein
LNRCQSERDKASAMLFIFPGICSAFNMILYCKDSETRFLTRVITLLDFEDFLKVTKPHHRIRVSQEMREDLKVWLSFLSDYNGITVMLDKKFNRPRNT